MSSKMDPRTLEILEFDKIKTMLASHVASGLGKELALTLEPVTNPEVVLEWQKETSEAREILDKAEKVPLGGIRDVRLSVRKAVIGSGLDPSELLDVAGTFAAARRLRKFLLEFHGEFPIMKGLALGIQVFKEIEDRVGYCISDEGKVLDKASPALQRIRTLTRAVDGRLKDKLDSILRSSENQRYIQEPVITIRNGRFVIPVKQEYKAQFPGIVHDQSASGATLFIEPMAVVELNNHLRELEAQEEEEVSRILKELTGLIRRDSREIESTLAALGRIDFAFSKAGLSLVTNGVEPVLNSHGRLDIRQARHPLLKGDVVPIDPRLGGEFWTVIITGPNTGGKTVALKTIGLLTLMAQSGLHVPAALGTEMAVFDHVFCDIGDEQSIEQSLSTFSSHMGHIVKILEELGRNAEAGRNVLVLLDELGAGTDPAEGTALAMAILEYLHERGVRTIATTHYNELKTFAYLRDGMENASAEFDAGTLRPTYRLLIGVPGSSNAFAIAERLGLSAPIVDRARVMMRKDDVRVDGLIQNIRENWRRSEEDRVRADAARQKFEELKAQYEQETVRLRRERSEAVRRAREEGSYLLNRARGEIDEITRSLRRQQLKSPAPLEEAVRLARERLKETARDFQEGITKNVEEETGEAGEKEAREKESRLLMMRPEDAKPGVSVWLPGLGQKGHIISGPDANGQVEVQLGIMKTVVPLVELEKSEEDNIWPGPLRSNVERLARHKALDISPEIHVRGLTVEEAMDRVNKYLDDACLAGLPEVRIVHGKGTGTLREAVRDLLRTHPNVKTFRPGGPGEGSYGVTVVELASD